MWTARLFEFMKGQDILLLFKMASLHAQEERLFGRMESETIANLAEALLEPSVSPSMGAGDPVGRALAAHNPDPEDTVYRVQEFDTPMGDADKWEGWSDAAPSSPVSSWNERYSLRALSASLGLSKSEVSNSMARCREAGLLTNDYDTSLPKVNRRELVKITEHALKYFYPVKLGAMVRGIPTGFAAPALSKSLKSAGGLIPVWPNAFGSERGQAIEPLYKTVPDAVKKDRTLYHYLALVDAIRVGGPRECAVAVNILKAGMGLK
ncbi:MarR family transcriptional regulator [Pseudomonas sp. C32]|uniref:MarR family transcriptional regulator n=1 Tax=Pseudomonas sp. C32 TaxID=1529208 RepID=UPI002603CF2D|nr:MarR family transcriptional regulator [Pseudomonas sp. C32]MDN4546538.1 MarR family transcriptional regulator [Pseudomonas sp. C32]